MEEISLVSRDGDPVTLKLNTVKKVYAVEELLTVRTRVYSDVPYSIYVENEQAITSILVYINGELADSVYRDGKIEFSDDYRCPFRGIIGLAQITLFVTYDDTTTEWKHTEYAAVLIKPTDTNKALDSMLKFVYENQEDILYRDAYVTGIGKENNQSYDDFWSQIVLLEDIANVYENSFGFFMANCRTKLENNYVLDRTEKLQEVTPQTLQYIVQHPEYLHKSVTGIKYGRRSFIPSKTLMLQKSITKDIYENQVVISFLEHLLSEITSLTDTIKSYLHLVQIDGETDDGYIVSSFLFYVNARDALKEFLDKLVVLEKKYRELVSSYANILDVKRVTMNKRPEPTPVFMSLPQYHRIYTCILRWFGKSGYDLYNEKVMLSFVSAPAIYEAYTLIKIINQIKDYGYSLDCAKLVNYPKRSNWKYSNKNYNNTFEFSNDNSKITLYYEPIVYDEDRSGINGISIYRNNSISIGREYEEERKGHYYVPDYVLKYETAGRERYLICDAKFSRKEKVQHQLMPDLIYKYVSSLSPINETSDIVGLFIFYGINEGNNDVASFYDRYIRAAKPITPYIETIPLSEGVSYSKQRDNSLEMLKVLVG